MFDLNLDISSRYQNNIQQVESSSALAAATQTTPDRVQLSGTSTSSVVNAADDRDSNHSSSALNFDVFAKLRTTDVDEEEEGEEVAGGMTSFAGGYLWQHRRPEYATRQLFPVDGDGSGGGGGFGVSCEGSGLTQAAESQWLKLSVSGSGGGVTDEMRILQQKQQQVRRSRRGPRSRSSQYRGVTFYRRTGRWESHIWDCGKQVYLGGFDTAHAAARAYDRAAIKFRGVDADINFTVTDYDEDMKQMKNLTKEEFVHVLRRQSTGFARGSSRFRGVNNSQRCGRWETWMGQYLGKKAYDQAALQYGFGEAPPFHPSNYGMKVPSEASNGGIGDNLDLTLGMSAPVGAHNANNNAGDLYYQNTFYQAADGKRPVMGNACYHPGVQALHGQPLPSRPPPAPIPGAFAGASTTHERSSVNHERKVGASALSSTRHSGWAWNGQMPPPAQGMVVGAGSSSLSVPIPLFSNDTSGAASSGFSSSNLQFHHFS